MNLRTQLLRIIKLAGVKPMALASDVPPGELRVSHFAYDTSGARRDPNVVLPLQPLQRAAQSGRIGELSPLAYTFMGGIYSARKVRQLMAPELARRLGEDEVDVALLVPV